MKLFQLFIYICLMKIKLLTLVCICFVNIVSGQKETNIWYFGSQAGLDFNSGNPVALTNGVMNQSEGCSSIADSNGNLLFYTDGITVWDRNHIQMPNGFGLSGGVSCTQSALIVPFPGNNLMYYIFTPEPYGSSKNFSYSEVDMSLNSGNGDVTIKNNFLIAPVTEKLTATRHSNNIDIWVMAHGDVINSFYAYLITASGISSPVISNAGTLSTIDDGVGQMKFSPDGTKIAYTSWGSNFVDLFDFNSTTGNVTNEKYITIPPGVTYGGYGLEFSSSGNYLYCAGVQTRTLNQWDITSNSAAIINTTRQLIDSTTTQIFGQLQLGPDGKIYVAKVGSGFLSAINNPELPGALCNYADSAVNLMSGHFSSLGLPNFITSYFLPTGISTNNAQQNQLSIYPNPADQYAMCNMQSAKNKNAELTVTDILGKIIFRKIFSPPTSDFRLPTSNFGNGIYFLNVQTEKARVTGKVVVQH